MNQGETININPSVAESINIDPDLRKTLLDSEIKTVPSRQVLLPPSPPPLIYFSL